MCCQHSTHAGESCHVPNSGWRACRGLLRSAHAPRKLMCSLQPTQLTAYAAVPELNQGKDLSAYHTPPLPPLQLHHATAMATPQATAFRTQPSGAPPLVERRWSSRSYRMLVPKHTLTAGGGSGTGVGGRVAGAPRPRSRVLLQPCVPVPPCPRRAQHAASGSPAGYIASPIPFTSERRRAPPVDTSAAASQD